MNPTKNSSKPKDSLFYKYVNNYRITFALLIIVFLNFTLLSAAEEFEYPLSLKVNVLNFEDNRPIKTGDLTVEVFGSQSKFERFDLATSEMIEIDYTFIFPERYPIENYIEKIDFTVDGLIDKFQPIKITIEPRPEDIESFQEHNVKIYLVPMHHDFSRDAIEVALNHLDNDGFERAYSLLKYIDTQNSNDINDAKNFNLKLHYNLARSMLELCKSDIYATCVQAQKKFQTLKTVYIDGNKSNIIEGTGITTSYIENGIVESEKRQNSNVSKRLRLLYQEAEKHYNTFKTEDMKTAYFLFKKMIDKYDGLTEIWQGAPTKDQLLAYAGLSGFNYVLLFEKENLSRRTILTLKNYMIDSINLLNEAGDHPAVRQADITRAEKILSDLDSLQNNLARLYQYLMSFKISHL